MQITLNGSALEAKADYLTYEDIAAMVGRESPTITFWVRKGLSGTLLPGRSLVLEDGMVIDATETNAA